MCGIAGKVSAGSRFDEAELTRLGHSFCASLNHRGPDSNGIWSDREAGVVLAHTRLSIVDLHESGHQPMVSASGRFVLVFNGEIYNHKSIRRDLLKTGVSFRGTSDTEVMLALIELEGLESALDSFVGMFAFALWDRQDRKLHLVRDRLGEKPLYYGILDSSFVFASELKAITSTHGGKLATDKDAVALLTTYGYIPAPYCIYEGFCKLPAGCRIEFDFSNGLEMPEPVPYWSALETVSQSARQGRPAVDPMEAVNQLDEVLNETIQDKMMADVPLGAFLSGGIDSSAIVALMQANSDSAVRTFSIGFNESEYNEAHYAKQVAEHLGTEHTELYVTSEQARSVIPKLPDMYDEPFADSSQIPTFLLSEMTRQSVTVALSGDGGDELFGGYSRYFTAQQQWNRLHQMPPQIKTTAKRLLGSIPAGVYDSLYRPLKLLLPGRFRYDQVGSRIHKHAEILDAASDSSIYGLQLKLWDNLGELIPGSRAMVTGHDMLDDRFDALDFLEKMMLVDAVTYLPDDIMVKVDRASMATSLECRAPFLDHRVFEFVWNLPPETKLPGGQPKWLLKKVLSKYVPDEIMERPKMGFGVPIDHWLRGPLRDWGEELLSESRLEQEGMFDARRVREKWLQHLSGDISWHYQLWPILMYQAWQEQQ